MPAAVVIAMGALLGWRGYRRGAAAMLLGWLPGLAAAVVLVGATRLAWLAPGRFLAVLALGFVAGAAAYGATWYVTRPRRRMLRQERAARGSLLRIETWRDRCDRVVGAVLGVVYALLLCLVLALLGSVGVFLLSGSRGAAADTASGPAGPELLQVLGNACREMGDAAGLGALEHVPGLAGNAREVRALITILNAPQPDLERAGERLGLRKLAAVPEVEAALADPEYIGLIRELGRGRLAALCKLAESPRSRRILESDEVRQFSRRLTPSQIARLLRSDPAE